MSERGLPRLDPVDLTARRWWAEDRIIASARRITRHHNLDPSYVERMESACLHGDQGGFERTLGELLDEVVSR